MHKSLYFQQNKYTRPNAKREKENEKPPGRMDIINENAQQKFKSLLQKQKNTLYPKKLKQFKVGGKENHSFVNIGNKENQMGYANHRSQFSGVQNMATSNVLRPAKRSGESNMNISISKHCKTYAHEKNKNMTSLHALANNDSTRPKNVFESVNSNKPSTFKEQRNTGSLHSRIITEESEFGLMGKGLGTSTVDGLSEEKSFELTKKKNLNQIYMESGSFFAEKEKIRESCDPMEFFLENIGNYYDRLIRERGQEGSIACGGDIFEVQKCLKQNMRVILFDWLFDLCQKWKMKLRTFVITITFTDAVLIRCTVTKEIFQLVGLACLFIAGKFEEIYPPSLEEYLDSCNNAYSREQLLQIETIILNSIQFNLVILNHLDILEFNLKQRLSINNKSIKIYKPGFCAKEQETLKNLTSLSEMFLMICLYDHRVHLMDMNSVVDFCIINAIRFVDRNECELSYRGVSSRLLEGYSPAGKDVGVFLGVMGGMGLVEFHVIEKMMKEMMKTVFDSRQYSIIIKYRQFFVKILRTYFGMI
jgi:hypothetical protein